MTSFIYFFCNTLFPISWKGQGSPRPGYNEANQIFVAFGGVPAVIQKAPSSGSIQSWDSSKGSFWVDLGQLWFKPCKDSVFFSCQRCSRVLACLQRALAECGVSAGKCVRRMPVGCCLQSKEVPKGEIFLFFFQKRETSWDVASWIPPKPGSDMFA